MIHSNLRSNKVERLLFEVLRKLGAAAASRDVLEALLKVLWQNNHARDGNACPARRAVLDVLKSMGPAAAQEWLVSALAELFLNANGPLSGDVYGLPEVFEAMGPAAAQRGFLVELAIRWRNPDLPYEQESAIHAILGALGTGVPCPELREALAEAWAFGRKRKGLLLAFTSLQWFEHGEDQPLRWLSIKDLAALPTEG